MVASELDRAATSGRPRDRAEPDHAAQVRALHVLGDPGGPTPGSFSASTSAFIVPNVVSACPEPVGERLDDRDARGAWNDRVPMIRSASPVERRDGTCELPIAAAEIPIDRTAHGAMSC